MNDWTHNLLPEAAQRELRMAALLDAETVRIDADGEREYKAVNTNKAIRLVKRHWPGKFRGDA